jgi:hypothetical protein
LETGILDPTLFSNRVVSLSGFKSTFEDGVLMRKAMLSLGDVLWEFTYGIAINWTCGAWNRRRRFAGEYGEKERRGGRLLAILLLFGLAVQESGLPICLIYHYRWTCNIWLLEWGFISA